MLENTIDDVSTQLFVIRISKLVIDNTVEHSLLLGQSSQVLELGEAQHRRFLNENMLAAC